MAIATLTLNPAIDGSSEARSVGHTRKIRTSNERIYPSGGGINVARVVGGRPFDLASPVEESETDAPRQQTNALATLFVSIAQGEAFASGPPNVATLHRRGGDVDRGTRAS